MIHKLCQREGITFMRINPLFPFSPRFAATKKNKRQKSQQFALPGKQKIGYLSKYHKEYSLKI